MKKLVHGENRMVVIEVQSTPKHVYAMYTCQVATLRGTVGVMTISRAALIRLKKW